MSYAFDTLSRAWQQLRKELPDNVRDGELAFRFEQMLEELHDANHRLRDAVNHDTRVTEQAHRLDRTMNKESS